MHFENTLTFAQNLDQLDPLKTYRNQFFLPTFFGKDVRYFTGNSLGLQAKSTSTYIQPELDDWAKYGVEAHFHHLVEKSK